MASRILEIVNEKGLHARAAAKFVTCVREFDVKATVTYKGNIVPATSIMGLLMLAVTQGQKIIVQAEGQESEAVLEGLGLLIQDGFGEL